MKSRKKTPIKPFGTLYHFTMTEPHGSVVINPRIGSKKERARQVVGAGLTSFAMALYLYSYGPVTSAELKKPLVEETKVAETINISPVVKTAEASTEQVKPIKAPDDSFTIYIPYLKLSAKVFENVDAFNEKEYSNILKEGVAQAKGTGLPGEGKRMFLFAHSTNSIFNIERYNAIFYDLGSVPMGETIDLYYKGEVYQYRVTSQTVVAASDVSWLSPHDGEELILQTCYPPGTSWKRLLVFAKPI